jgi:hypothetical protein
MGRPGTRKWGFGVIACSADEGAASILWTDQRSQMLGRIDGDAADLQDMYAWWQDNARPLGRSDEPEPGTDPQSTAAPSPDQSGTNTSNSCAAVSDPIVDEYGRIWEVDRVEFRERGQSERVIVHLERVGNRRNARNSQVVVRRLPISDLGTAVPNAPRPRSGKTATVVDLDGIRKAPNLRGFRPTSTNIIKELSVVPNGGSRSVVVSTAKGTCYTVRVPVFSASSNGRETTAQVILDLK